MGAVTVSPIQHYLADYPASFSRRPLRHRYEMADRTILLSDQFLDQPLELGGVNGRALTHQAVTSP